MTLTFELDAPPLNLDESGTVRVSKTRVTLDALIEYYHQGQSAEQLHIAFPTVPLADVHAVIAYYLRNRSAVDEYIEQRRTEGQRIREQIERQQDPELKESLLAKKRLSGGE